MRGGKLKHRKIALMSRYARQIALPEIGTEGQARLAAAQVLVVGAGGLGSPALQYLAGAGVGRLTVVDPDVVARENLHRQTLYDERFIGSMKAASATVALGELNPEVHVRPVFGRLDPGNAPALVAAADLVLDCADSFAASYTLSDACREAGKPLVSASALGLGGYAGGFCGGAPSLRAVFPDLPARAASCATAGILGPVVGLLGCLQAQMALAILLGLDPSPLGQLVSFEGAGLRFGGFRFDGAPEPERPLAFLAAQAIAPADFVADLRAADEAPAPATPWAHRLAVADFGPDGPRPAAGQRAVLVCRSGLRAWQAGARLRAVWDGDIRLVATGDQERETP